MSELYRYHAMEDRRVGVRQWISEAEAISFIRDSYDREFAATRTDTLRNQATPIPYDPPILYPTKPTLGVTNHAGIPIGTTLTAMTPAQVNALGPGVEVIDKHIIGEMSVTGAVARVFRNCLLEGTDTEGTLTLVGGELELTAATAPNYAITNGTTATPFELHSCEVRHAKKLLLAPGGAVLDKCYLHDGGEDGLYASIQWADITVTDTIIARCGNLRYHSQLGWKTSLMHPDLAQIRGQDVGFSAIFTRVVFDGQSANTAGGPIGDGWGTINACVMAQTGDGPIRDVRLIDCWLASGGNWTIYMESKNYGQIESFTLTGNEIARTSTSGPLVNHGASGTETISGNIDLENQASIDATMLAGTGW